MLSGKAVHDDNDWKEVKEGTRGIVKEDEEELVIIVVWFYSILFFLQAIGRFI